MSMGHLCLHRIRVEFRDAKRLWRRTRHGFLGHSQVDAMYQVLVGQRGTDISQPGQRLAGVQCSKEPAQIRLSKGASPGGVWRRAIILPCLAIDSITQDYPYGRAGWYCTSRRLRQLKGQTFCQMARRMVFLEGMRNGCWRERLPGCGGWAKSFPSTRSRHGNCRPV
ncbi:hypothetical protein BKA81DRAFT_189180 [Phyllosticta paracitricarpa]